MRKNRTLLYWKWPSYRLLPVIVSRIAKAAPNSRASLRRLYLIDVLGIAPPEPPYGFARSAARQKSTIWSTVGPGLSAHSTIRRGWQ